MFSKSRAAQQALSELEKRSAKFEDQLVEAARFIGSDLDIVSGSASRHNGEKEEKKAITSHGKEEWLLRWLLKKLQAPKDEVARRTPLSWNLILHLLRRLPLPIAARILGERKFVTILQKTLDEVKQRPVEEADNIKSNSLDEKESTKKSKKRKRSGETVAKSSILNCGIQSLFSGILAVVDFIVDSTKYNSGIGEHERDAEFSAEYMRTVLRSSAEDSAKLLGSWLLALEKYSTLLKSPQLPWLFSFIEIWQLHVADENYLMHFSLHCTLPLLLILGNLPAPGPFGTQIERLLARNIVIPSKMTKEENTESNILNELTKLAVISDPMNASRLFGIAIRSIQPQGVKRRHPNDETWLQTVFSSLKDSMPPKRADRNGKAICAMIQSAMLHKVDLELEVLRSVTSEYAFPQGGQTYWELLQSMIQLDANVFLIPNTEKDLLQDLLARINLVSVGVEYLDIPKLVIEDVILPLMGAFAKARDLTGFMHHWLTQLIVVEKSRKALSLHPSQVFGVWEDSRLQEKVQKLLGSFLSTNQITQLLDWLQSQILENPGPVSVILQAISGSTAGEEVVDAVNLRCYHIMFDKTASEALEDRYKWRSWNILLNSLIFASRAGVEEISSLWMEAATPFNSLSGKLGSSKLMDIHNADTDFGALELWKFACASWTVARNGGRLQRLARPLVLDLLKRFNLEVKLFLQSAVTNSKRLDNWMMSQFVKCLFETHPEVLVLAAEAERQDTREMLKNVFWIASARYLNDGSGSGLPELNNPPDPATTSYSDMWLSALQADCILNSSTVTEMMIDTMLDNDTNKSNPLIDSAGNNAFSVLCLLKVPISTLHRKHRERIMKAWPLLPSEPDADSTPLVPAVLALKIKTMRFPMFYEGMDFKQFSNMAIALSSTNTPSLCVSLSLFKELSKLTLDFVITNIGQTRNQSYIKEAFSYVQKSIKRSHKQTSHETSFASIALFEVVIESIRENSKALFETDTLRGKDVTKVEALVHDSLSIQLQASLQHIHGEGATEWENDYVIISILDAFDMLGLERDRFQDIRETAERIHSGEGDVKKHIRSRVDAFLASQTVADLDNELAFKGADISTLCGRKAIRDRTQLVLDTTNRGGKMGLVVSILRISAGGSLELGQLLAARLIIISIDDTRQSKKSHDSDTDSSDDDEEPLNLSVAYSLLCLQLQKAKSIRHFCLICETLEVMLRTKARSISQWNIDSTLGCISNICSRNSPALRAARGSTIYLHLCRLFQAILISHRLKLEGHFHIVIQAIQSLLRCLFLPLPYSSTKTLRNYGPPSWLSTTPSTYPLNGTHATAFTRLITLICDPSVSSVTRSSHNNLSSATDKAKRMAGQHMQFVLMSYVRLQLEMKMLPEMRLKMTPGLYAIFDTTTVELRRCVSEGLDSSGRAVFGMLYKDYMKFGKWKGL